MDTKIILKVLNERGGRSTAPEVRIPKAILPGTVTVGCTNDLLCKELGLCLEQAETRGVRMMAGKTAHQLREYAPTGPRDYSTITQYIERWGGLKGDKAE